MASLKCTLKWTCQVNRQYRSLLHFSNTYRKVHIASFWTKNYEKIAYFYGRKYSRTASRQSSTRTFSTEPDNVVDCNIDITNKPEATSSVDVDVVIASGHLAKLTRRKQSKDSISSTETIDQNEETIEIPSDLTEREFIEVAKRWELEKYAKMRLAKLSPEEEKRFKILKLHYDVLMSVGARVPKEENMTDGRWLYLLICKQGESAVKGQLMYWCKLDYTVANEVDKKEKKEKPVQDVDHSALGPLLNTITRKIVTATMNVHHYNNLAFSMQFGQPLIFDFSFADAMKMRELNKTVMQFKHSHAINKVLWEPFHMHICGFPNEGKFFHLLKNTMTDLWRPDLPVTFTTKDITEMDHIPRERLVYLSPNSPYVLTRFNHDDVYVIGGVVDTGSSLPLTYAKSKRLKIRSARLPLDRYLVFQGSKELTLNHVIGILADLKKGMSMKDSVIKNVPTRKVQRNLETDEVVFVEHKYTR